VSGTAEEWDRRRDDAARWQRLDKRLDRFDERLATIEEKLKDDVSRRKHVREFFEDFGRWLGYGGKLVGALAVIGGAIYAIIQWIAQNGG
jgi:hypothetical protein